MLHVFVNNNYHRAPFLLAYFIPVSCGKQCPKMKDVAVPVSLDVCCV